MPTYKIRGIDVDFPFEAYDGQIVYMEKVIYSLQTKCNALLESPTGTGKTLCLLCATLAWRKSLGGFSNGRCEWKSQNAERRSLGGFSTGRSEWKSQKAESNSDGAPSQSKDTNLPTIIYTSRTHSQLRQVVKELKRSNYRPKMVVLGSREQLCIHDEVSSLCGKAQTNACHFLCRKREKREKSEKREEREEHDEHHCVHYSRAPNYVKNNPHLGDEPIDIEDMVNIGKRFGPCPYYVSRELHKVVDIIFAPYNYLIDRGYRKSLSLEWENSILIFDEAHNLESLCADAASFDLPSGILTACISEAKKCADLCVASREKSNDKSRNPDSFAILRALLLKLEKRIAEVPIESKELGFTKPGPYIYEMLADLNITHETASMLIGIIEEAAVLLEESKMQKTKGTVCRLESISNILNIIFRDKDNGHATFYRVHVQKVEVNAVDALKGKATRTLSWWCFNPGIAMEEFSRMGVGSIILTSGTLSPLDSFAQELKLEFPVRLENPHVISPNQIWAGVVPAGPSGNSFNSSYRNRDSLEYKQELGNAIVNFARIVPDGLLVFFPSYYHLDQCIGCWKNMSHSNSKDSSTIWERICKHKRPVIEPRQSSLFPLSIEDYMAKLKETSNSGAVFFAVCRGKVSEGLDFADHAGRAVVITGLPFATRTDPKVRLKREYLDQQAQSQREGCKVLIGEEWYNQQASRAVNQAVGRVIRHRHDYGAIILCDERFAHSNRQSQISSWIQPHIKCYSKFGDVVFSLTRFFRGGETRGPTKMKLLPIKDSVLDEGIDEAQLEDTPSSIGSSTSAHGNVRELKTVQPLDQMHLEKFVALTTPLDQNFSRKSLSSILEVKRGNASSQLGEVLPANRSSLSPYKKNQALTAKCSSDIICNEKKLLIIGKKNMQYQNREITELTGNFLLEEKPSQKELIAPCFTKKRKLLNTEHDETECVENSHELSSGAKKSQLNGTSFTINSVKHENSQISDKSMQNVQVDSALLCKSGVAIQKRDAEFLTQKGKGVQSKPVPRVDEETRGSAFLIQVKEKLSAIEYKEFVGFMKALKSKAMKIGHVLQSIVRLFSGPERLPLLKRFKDYIPAKYHSLYEQYLEENDDTSGSNLNI